jgi:hypothetical protein
MPVLLVLVQTTQNYLGKAAGVSANIVVDAAVSQGPIVPIWQMLAQGGEEKFPFDKIIPQITQLKPKYIRIDHVFDFYDVVDKKDGSISYNYSQLDKVVNQITSTGALPFFSLSYMPPAIAQDGQLLNPPNNWNDWSTLVKRTIQHYSGRSEFNLTNVAYEIWNEPDLFGNWKINGGKDYRLLYQYAVLGANQTKNTNPFKIGGPATTAPYENWVDQFLNFIAENHLRLDFYSWHRYAYDPQIFLDDINRVDTWLFQNGAGYVEKYITESGPDSNDNPIYNSRYAAAHQVVLSRKLLQRVGGFFAFEIKDGLTSRWGILTATGQKKPRYWALNLLNKMAGTRLLLEGEGTWVTGFAGREGNIVRLILVNLDINQNHDEAVPIIITNLDNGDYSIKLTSLTNSEQKDTQIIRNNTFTKTILMKANEVVLLELVLK